jgi:hypoxia-inducible factor (prolyl hydroxylase)
MHSAGIFKKGQLMSASGTSNLNHVRGDVLTWVDGSQDGCEDIGFLISSMDAVVLKCGGA